MTKERIKITVTYTDKFGEEQRLVVVLYSDGHGVEEDEDDDAPVELLALDKAPSHHPTQYTEFDGWEVRLSNSEQMRNTKKQPELLLRANKLLPASSRLAHVTESSEAHCRGKSHVKETVFSK